jgi:hypothetical protein
MSVKTIAYKIGPARSHLNIAHQQKGPGAQEVLVAESDRSPKKSLQVRRQDPDPKRRRIVSDRAHRWCRTIAK